LARMCQGPNLISDTLGRLQSLNMPERTSLLILHLLTAKTAALDKVACKALPDWDREKA
jgi:hypothetical protein